MPVAIKYCLYKKQFTGGSVLPVSPSLPQLQSSPSMSSTSGGVGLDVILSNLFPDEEAVLRRLGFREWGREPAAHDLPGGGTADEVHWELTRGGAAGTGSR